MFISSFSAGPQALFGIGGRRQAVSRVRGQDRLDFESGVWDFAGGDSEAGRGLHFGNRQGHLKNGKGKVTGVSFQLRPFSQKQNHFQQKAFKDIYRELEVHYPNF